MPIEQKNVTITDDDDIAQSYVIAPHPATEAVAILRVIAKITAGPLAALLASPDDAKGGEMDLDPGKIASALAGVADVIADSGDAELAKKLLKWTHRKVAGTAAMQNCAADFDTIYTQNYSELFAACYHALDCNFGKSLRKTKGRSLFRGALEKIAPKTPESATQTSPK